MNREIRLDEYMTVVEPSDELPAYVNTMSTAGLAMLAKWAPFTPEKIQLARETTDALVKDVMPEEDLEKYRKRRRIINIDTAAERIRVQILEPEGDIRGGMLHIHGGGWFFGYPEMAAPQLITWADQMGVVVASVEYRFAPENPYPAAPDDCEAAALWWIEYARKQYGIEKIIVGGESAGAHLSAVTAIRMRRRHGYRFAAAKLTYGMFDFSNGLPSRGVADGRNLVQDSQSCELYAELFVPDRAMRRDPDVSPVYADVTDMPPAIFTVGTLDPLLDDSLILAANWRIAGNKTNLVIYRGAPHGFDIMPVPEQLHHYTFNMRFLKHCLEA